MLDETVLLRPPKRRCQCLGAGRRLAELQIIKESSARRDAEETLARGKGRDGVDGGKGITKITKKNSGAGCGCRCGRARAGGGGWWKGCGCVCVWCA